MSKLLTFLFALALTMSFGFSQAPEIIAAPDEPVAVLSQVKGEVEYSKDGKKWRAVRRNKFLKADYLIRSGADGSGKVMLQASGDTFELGPNTEFIVKDGKLVAKKGKLAAAGESSALVAGLMKRFDKSQSYTTVRRAASSKKVEVESARELTLSDAYPYIVFESAGEQFSYEVKVGNEVYKVSPTKEELVRLKVKPFKGNVVYSIDVLKSGKKVFTMKPYRKGREQLDRQLSWLSEGKERELAAQAKQIQEAFPGNDALLSKLYEQEGLYVAAMDSYRDYLKANPDDEDIYPYYFWVIKKQLFLDELYRNEMTKYKELTEE
ncbi:MAG: hypothetical protein RRB13_13455 [bacterium]|nr:hypothetical protein [bacterium]